MSTLYLGLLQKYVGCLAQMNLADSERMAGVLEDIGYMNTEDPAAADVIIYNTCSIRDKAEQKVYSALGRQVPVSCSRAFPVLLSRTSLTPTIYDWIM